MNKKVFTCPYCGQQGSIVEVTGTFRGTCLDLHLEDEETYSWIDYQIDTDYEDLRHSEVIHLECALCNEILLDNKGYTIYLVDDLLSFFK